MEWIILLFTFLTVFLLVWAGASMLGFIHHTVDDRLRDWTPPHPSGDDPVSALRKTRAKEGVVASLGKRVAPRKPKERGESLMRLRNAGFYSEFAFHVYWGLKILITMGMAGAATLFFVWYGTPSNQMIMLGIFIVGGALFLPDVFLYLCWRRRQEQIFLGLPDALDLMVVCIESGLGLDASLQRISHEFHRSNQVLSNELKLTVGAIRLGQARSAALQELGERTGSPDLKSLISVLVQSERFGTSLAQALRVHSDDMRSRRRQRAEEIAAQSTVKMIFPLVLFIFPSIFVVLAGPAAIRVMESVLINR